MHRLEIAALAVVVAATSACARRMEIPAPPERPQQAQDDPPGRVARLAYAKGPVSFRAAGTSEWVAAELNRPLTAHDDLWTDREARAELDTGDASIRLDSSTGVTFLTLDDRLTQIKMTGGTVQIGLRHLEDSDSFEVAAPNAAITLLRAGDYRVEALSESEVRVTVRSGSAEVASGGEAFVVRAGQQARLTGLETVARDTGPAPPLDPFDDFCRTRDARHEKAESRKYVSNNTIGWEDLDGHGYWREYPAWGPVWIPRHVAPGWARYRFGHWVWIEPWGWTWIDEAPWGFAPFHYGRWVIVDAAWVWIPGPVRVRAVYAPALVVFVGGGGLRWHVRVGVGIGVGWFPLGPREVWIPPYRASHRYVTRINHSHTVIHQTVNVWNVDPARQRYANHRAPGAITAVHEDVFKGGRPISRAVADVPSRVDDLHVRGTAPPVAPDRRSMSRHDEAGTRAVRPPETVERRRVVVRETPAPRTAPFEQRREQLERDPGRPPDSRTADELRRRQPESRPDYRQVPAPRTRQPEEARRSPAPSPRVEERQSRRAEERTARQQEQRRREIEQEHRRQPEPPKAERRTAEPESRRERRER